MDIDLDIDMHRHIHMHMHITAGSTGVMLVCTQALVYNKGPPELEKVPQFPDTARRWWPLLRVPIATDMASRISTHKPALLCTLSLLSLGLKEQGDEGLSPASSWRSSLSMSSRFLQRRSW